MKIHYPGADLTHEGKAGGKRVAANPVQIVASLRCDPPHFRSLHQPCGAGRLAGMCFARCAGMTDRHQTIVEASERFADQARSAVAEGKHARAALLYWAAAMVLDGHSVGEIGVLLDTFSTGASGVLRSGILHQETEMPHLKQPTDWPRPAVDGSPDA